MSEAWSQWQGQIIDGKFHLTQYLGGSGASAVFLAHLYSPDNHTQRADQRPVAIRLIANCDNPELQLSRWRMIQGMEHPHLIQLCDTGRCQPGDIDLIYAVMEYGDETVAQILPQRPLTVEEAREMLVPTIDVLTYLHHRGLVHGHVKPANIMAIADQLKLSSDGIRPADQPVSPAPVFDVSAVHTEQFSPPPSGLYDAPETAGGVWSPAADVWSLGITLAEVLTQSVPSRDELNQPGSDPLLPADLPVEFVEIVRGCLRRDLELRWTIPAIKARLEEDRGRAMERARVSAAAASSMSSAGAGAGIESAAAVMTLEPPTRLAVMGSSGYSPLARDTTGIPSLAASGPIQNVSTARDLYPTNLETAIALEEPEISSPAPPTFAQALRAKPVVSEKSSMSQERMVAAAVSLPTVMPVANAARADVIRIVDSDLEDSKMVVRVPEPTAKLNIIEEEEQSGLSRFLAQTRALQARTVVLFTGTMFKMRRLTCQARAALEQKTASTRPVIRRVATRIEDFLGLYPARTMVRFAVAAAIVAAAMVALYMGLESLRHKPAAHVTHQAKAPLNVVVVKPEKKAGAKKHASATQSPAKPQPGTPLAAASQPRTQPPAPVQQTAAQTASAPGKQTAPQSSTQAAAQPPSVSSGTRRIDDGGAQENANAPAQQQAESGQGPAQPVGIAQQVMPQVSQSALHTIRGTVRVNVRVRVDPSGNVARAVLASAGPSRYFARKSLEAAQSWKFAPGASSPYLVHFEFRNNGARAFATRVGS